VVHSHLLDCGVDAKWKVVRCGGRRAFSGAPCLLFPFPTVRLAEQLRQARYGRSLGKIYGVARLATANGRERLNIACSKALEGQKNDVRMSEAPPLTKLALAIDHHAAALFSSNNPLASSFCAPSYISSILITPHPFLPLHSTSKKASQHGLSLGTSPTVSADLPVHSR
jgi:hypothetical protein